MHPEYVSQGSGNYSPGPVEREFFIDSLLVRIHFIIVMVRWTGIAPWEFELPFPGSLPSTSLEARESTRQTRCFQASMLRLVNLCLALLRQARYMLA